MSLEIKQVQFKQLTLQATVPFDTVEESALFCAEAAKFGLTVLQVKTLAIVSSEVEISYVDSISNKDILNSLNMINDYQYQDITNEQIEEYLKG